LSGANLSGVDFKGAVLKNADLSLTDLSGSIISVDQLKSASSYQGVILQSFDFTGADLSLMDFGGIDLRNSLFRNANLTNTDLAGANITGADLTGARMNGTDLMGTIGVTADMLLAAKSYENVKLQEWSEYTSQVDQVCRSGAVPQAYPGKARFHPLAIRSDNEQYYMLPDNLPFWIGIVDLAVCIQAEQYIVQTCGPYYWTATNLRAPDIQRIRLDRIVQIYKAQTGELVESKVFEGGQPRKCQDQEQVPTTWERYTPYPVYGDSVSDDQIWDWLAPLVDSN